MHSKVMLLCIAVFFLAVVTVNSENAFYIPRSFYVIDAEGHQSARSVIGAKHQNAILHRLKRSAAGGAYLALGTRSLPIGQYVHFQQPAADSRS